MLPQSQTQRGTRYTPHLTRFYATLGPSLLTPFIQEYLESVKVKCKPLPAAVEDRGREIYKIRIGGYDLRKQMFKGWVEVEKFSRNGIEGSYCLMRRDEVNIRLTCPLGPILTAVFNREILFRGDSSGRD